MLAGYKQPLGSCVPCDAIEHRLRTSQLSLRGQASQVYDGIDLAAFGIDAQNKICLPNIRPNLAVNIFQLIQLVYGIAVDLDFDLTHWRESLWIHEL